MNTIVVEEDITNITTSSDPIILNETNISVINTSSDIITVEHEIPTIIQTAEQGPQGIPGPAGDEELKYDLILDEVNAEGDLYVGEAIPGAPTAAAAWRIYFYDVTGALGEKRYADGTAEFNKVWDDRLTYAY